VTKLQAVAIEAITIVACIVAEQRPCNAILRERAIATMNGRPSAERKPHSHEAVPAEMVVRNAERRHQAISGKREWNVVRSFAVAREFAVPAVAPTAASPSEGKSNAEKTRMHFRTQA